jgi:uncharacterized protein (TIGR00730 family)
MAEKINVEIPEEQVVSGPLSLSEMAQATQDRIYEISREFTQGFKFLEKFPRSVTFFGSTRFREDNEHYMRARHLASRIATELKYTVASGGGPGIMEAANRGAKESGGNSIGLTIRLPREQIINDHLSSHVDFYYFFSRKVCLLYSAEAFLFFPGGYGTLDEFFEVVTLLQTRKIPPVPVILVGKDFWNKTFAYIKENLLDFGTIDQEDLSLFTITDDEEEILNIIRKAPIRESVPYKGLRVNPINE